MTQFATLDVTSLGGPPAGAQVEIVNGRYRIPDPETGKPKLWTRATTMAKTVADEYHLTRWKLRQVATGLATRPDLLASVASSLPADLADPSKDEKDTLNGLCEQAMDAAGSAKGSNMGTALHNFTDAVDSGRTIPPGQWDTDIAAYRAAMSVSPYRILPDHIEQIVTVPEMNVAGKFDRIVHHLVDDVWVIGDLKTAKSLDLGWGEIAIQLALYSRAATIFDPAAGTHTPMPAVDQNRALVMHLPVGRADCRLYEVDIAAGWEMAQVCLRVRRWRNRSDLAQQVNAITTAPPPAPAAVAAIPDTPSDPFEGLPDDTGRPQTGQVGEKRAWLVDRRDAIVAAPGGLDQLARRWPPGVPTFRQSDTHTGDQLTAIETLFKSVEDELGLRWPDPDPTDPTMRHVPIEDPRVLDLVRRGRALPPDLEASVFAAARHERVPRLSLGPLTEAHVTTVTRLIEAAETEAGPRVERVDGLFDIAADHSVTEAALCSTLGVPGRRHVHGPVLDLLDTLVDAVAHPDRIVVERDGRLVVDQPAVILAAYGDDRRRVIAAGRQAAAANGLPAPRSADEALAHPILAAVLAAV